MRLLIPFSGLTFFAFVIEIGFQFYLFHLFRKKKNVFFIAGVLSSLLSLFILSMLYFSWQKVVDPETPDAYMAFSKITPYVLVILLVKFISVLFLALEKLVCFLLRFFKHFNLAWISKTGLVINTILVFIMLVGILYIPNHVRVLSINLNLNGLPASFNGLRLVQISDTHFGSYEKGTEMFSAMVDSVKSLNPDIIVFTGDFVNNFANEMDSYLDVFFKLKAPLGKFAVLGNHDYSDYKKWASPAQKLKNSVKIKQNIEKMGFVLLQNQNVALVRNTDSIFLAGVENWGRPPFLQYGNLELATKNIPIDGFVVLLSHNPDLWEAQVQEDARIRLTLSGHTHGMQMGIREKYLDFSPASFIYPYWGGLYSQNGQHLYVNVGVGCLGMTARFGMRPEISLITLFQ